MVCDWLIGPAACISAQHLVRTDSREQKLDAFLVSRNSAAQTNASSAVSTDDTDDFMTTVMTDGVSVSLELCYSYVV